MKDYYVVRVRKKYQITIPKEMRKELNLNAGDYVLFSLNKYGQVVMDKAAICSYQALMREDNE